MLDDGQRQALVDLRRDIHRFPELRFEEHRTGEVVCKKLDELGIPWVRSAFTGVVAWLGDDQRPTVALRADMDALPIAELSGVPWASENAGKMHACGHDGHVAMLLGAAQVLAEKRHRLRGNVRFLFQPAEEGGHGARKMVEEGLWRGQRTDWAFAIHNWPNLPLGTWGLRSGGVMAANDVLTVRITGRGGHASEPFRCIDPVYVAAQFLVAVQGVVSRQQDAHSPIVVSFCTMQAGTATNVIPDEAVVSGTLRTLSRQDREEVPGRLKQVLDGVCAAFGAQGTLTVGRGYPVTFNDVGATEIAARAARKVGKWDLTHDVAPCMGSEDFSYFAEVVPSAYIWMGTQDAEHSHVCHQARYDFNDKALPAGVEWFVRVVEETVGID